MATPIFKKKNPSLMKTKCIFYIWAPEKKLYSGPSRKISWVKPCQYTCISVWM